MATYRYKCDNGHTKVVIDSIHNKQPDRYSCQCGLDAWRVYGFQTKPNTGIFQPYVEVNMPGGPVEITTVSQRERLCQEHGVSYDSYKHCNLDHKRRKNQTEGMDISFDEVMTQYKKDKGEWL